MIPRLWTAKLPLPVKENTEFDYPHERTRAAALCESGGTPCIHYIRKTPRVCTRTQRMLRACNSSIRHYRSVHR